MLLKINSISRDILRDLGIKKTNLIIGDIRMELGRDLMRALEKVVNNKSHLESYYLLIHAKNFGRNIRTTLMPSLVLPPKMLGTICYFINNKEGSVERLWTLPLDLPTHDAIIETGQPIENVIESGKDMPIK